MNARVGSANASQRRDVVEVNDFCSEGDLDDEVDLLNARMERVLGHALLPALECLISESAYWYGHPHGPVRAPKHADRLQCGPHGWEVEFGANKFLAESALRTCMVCIEMSMDEAARLGDRPSWEETRDKLRAIVRYSVANHDDREYGSAYPSIGGFMHFGTQAINVRAFVDCLYRKLKLGAVFIG